MVLFWPWKGVDASPASFEKALAGLAAKISDTQAKLDHTRSAARRVRVLATLYLSFAYVVYAIVLVLVVGYRNLGALEWSGIAGGPLAIYTVRTVLDAYFNFRIDMLTARLKDFKAEREKTILKLKAATKYDSTLELLEKYGGVETKQGDHKNKGRPRLAHVDDSHAHPSSSIRTGLKPPATANIARGTPPPPPVISIRPSPDAPDAASGSDLDVSAEFAPNAFGPDTEDHMLLLQQLGSRPASAISRPATANTRPGTATSVATTALAPPATMTVAAAAHPHWYDRLLDLLMGEDEMAAKNRIVLVCGRCRLVNGQAPPGTRSLAELGKWRCMGCGAANGEVAETKPSLGDVLEKRQRLRPQRASSRPPELSDCGSELEPDEAEDTDSEADRKTHS
ncbi:hypothetical protein CMQ_1772 [Grosmannia clavigera kw1407]|uniref:Endoplasmic reticulum junction formation protein lunapark n=1 Tax=Grosmannia clavigera (strain kw1407 / UAMH 11150) TaxID=655863 RepID=F0XAZ3_GROCL|nr:uncharacterized protein CMQ_1772 [Grosmannia clavigera kw1407]EFX05136.1 hypothetical protein CMQ_1772 [Grosmannia clavigera kw1407]